MALRIILKSLFLEKEITYDGTQLTSHWILNNTKITGDALVSFIGRCHVDSAHLVDLEDVIQNKPIFSESMLHFLIEHFDADLEKMILRQRLFISLIQHEISECVPHLHFVRKGDDLYLDHYKLSVSIATSSPVSQLIHTGINILSHNTPVPTKGLADFDINPQAFAQSVMNRYREEIETIRWARSKVRGVL